MAIARVAGVGEQPFATRFGKAGEGQVQRPGCAVGDGDAACRHGHAIVAAIEIRDRLAQFGQADGLGIEGFAAFYGVDRGIRYRRWCREIRLANFHVDDVAAFGLQLVGAGE